MYKVKVVDIVQMKYLWVKLCYYVTGFSVKMLYFTCHYVFVPKGVTMTCVNVLLHS